MTREGDDHEFDTYRGAYSGCRFCKGSGCLACRGEAERDRVTVPAPPAKPKAAPTLDLQELPDDLAEAFEQFKLAVLNHKLAGWSEVSRDVVMASLASLAALAERDQP